MENMKLLNLRQLVSHKSSAHQKLKVDLKLILEQFEEYTIMLIPQ